jgi:hypothetical protein
MHYLIELVVAMIDKQSWWKVQNGKPKNKQSLLLAFCKCFQEEIKTWCKDKQFS